MIIKTAGKDVLKRPEQGSITLHSKHGSMKLEGALKHSQLSRNLLSVSKLVAHPGVKDVVFNRFGAIVQSRSGQPMLTATLQNGLYLFKSDPNQMKAFAMMTKAEMHDLWHARLCHPGSITMFRLAKSSALTGIEDAKSAIGAPPSSRCKQCVKGKMSRPSFAESKPDVVRASRPLMTVHSDLHGPIEVPSLSGALYTLVIVDEFSQYVWIELLQSKGQAAGKIIEWVKKIKTAIGVVPVEFHSDRGTEFLNDQLKQFFSGEGITHSTSLPYTPQHNGIAERMNRTLKDAVRTIMTAANAPKILWGEAIHTVVRVRNLTAVNESGKSPRQRFVGKDEPMDGSRLKVWGCDAIIKVPDPLRQGSYDPKGIDMIHVGPSSSDNGYRMLNPLGELKVTETRDVVFYEHSFVQMASLRLQLQLTDEAEENENDDYYATVAEQNDLARAIAASQAGPAVAAAGPIQPQSASAPPLAPAVEPVVSPPISPIARGPHTHQSVSRAPSRVGSPDRSALFREEPNRQSINDDVFNESDVLSPPTATSASDEEYRPVRRAKVKSRVRPYVPHRRRGGASTGSAPAAATSSLPPRYPSRSSSSRAPPSRYAMVDDRDIGGHAPAPVFAAPPAAAPTAPVSSPAAAPAPVAVAQRRRSPRLHPFPTSSASFSQGMDATGILAEMEADATHSLFGKAKLKRRASVSSDSDSSSDDDESDESSSSGLTTDTDAERKEAPTDDDGGWVLSPDESKYDEPLSPTSLARIAARDAATKNRPMPAGGYKYTRAGEVITPTQRCTANSKTGQQCKMKTRNGQFCHNHLRTEMGLRIKKSEIVGAGRNLVAAKDFKKGEHITDYVGDVTIGEEGSKLPSAYMFSIRGKPPLIQLDAARKNTAPGRLVNDPKGSGKKANVDWKLSHRHRTLRMVAKRPIKKNDVLYIRYGRGYWKSARELHAAKREAKRKAKQLRKVQHKGLYALALKAEAQLSADPTTHAQAMQSPDAEQWKLAEQREMKSLKEMNVFTPVTTVPKGGKLIGTRIVYKTKFNIDGTLDKHKARLVAQGFTQRDGIDYDETFSGVVQRKSLMILLAFACYKGLTIIMLDIETAFLHADIDRPNFIRVPPGYDGPPATALRLNKALYGLHQAGRLFTKDLERGLKEAGYTQCEFSDTCVYVRTLSNGRTIIIATYVDDMPCFFAEADRAEFESDLAKFKVKYKVTNRGSAPSILNMRITRDLKKKTLIVDQELYTQKLLAEYGQSDGRTDESPGSKGQLSTRDAVKLGSKVTVENYRACVGSLGYLATCTRPDISHAVGMLQ